MSSSLLYRYVVAAIAAVYLLALLLPTSAQVITASITTPTSTTTVGVNGAGWLIDVQFTATSTAGNAILSPPNFFPQFKTGLDRTLFLVGDDDAGLGFVCLFNPAPQGNLTNLAGLFQINAVASSNNGFNKFRTIWYLGGAGFGLGTAITATVFLVSGTAPLTVPSNPALTPNIVSSIAVVTFNTSTTTSVTSSTSAFTGPAPAVPTALNTHIFSPAAGDLVGVNGAGWVIDLVASASNPTFNPLLSSGAGYSPLFDNTTNPAIFRPGFNTAAPGLVVLLNTTQTITGSLIQGPNTNLAGLFQMNGVLQVNGVNGFVNEIWPAWQVGNALFGQGPCTLTVYVLNTTAPTQVVGTPQQQPGLISTVSTVSFFISAPAATVLGDPSFNGFHGQAAYQVHGIPGEVFNVLTASTLQLNALFTFIDIGEAMTAAQMAKARTIRGSALPTTQPWSHPGTYLTEMGLRLGSLAIHFRAGRYADGLTAKTATGEPLLAGQSLTDGVMRVAMSEDGHSAVVSHPLVRFSIVNSDGFFNIDRASLLSSTAITGLDGLLGQSADPEWRAGRGEEFEEHMLLDYWVSSAVQHSTFTSLFSSEFKANKFQAGTAQ